MIDIKFIRENPELIKEACRQKQVEVDIDRLLELDNQKRNLLQKVETLRSERNKISEQIAKKRTENLIKQAKEIKEKTSQLEEELKKVDQEYNQLLYLVPNPPLDDVPEGKDESENVVVKEVGKRTEFDFEPKPYWEIGESLDLIDVKRAAKTSGTRFGFLKNEGALLEFALINFALKILSEHGFVPVVTPVLIRPEMMKGMGYVERGEDQIYRLATDDFYLIGTSEQIIGPMHSNEVFEEKELPKRYVGFSSCFRREAGTYGKDTKGIFRVHQFDKVEMFVFCKPEDSIKEHQLILSLEEKIMQGLELPYRIVQMCTGDLGDPAASKYDVEAWFPSLQQYRETHSASNCTDFQARRLNIRYKDKKSGKLEFVHTLNGTAIAIGRTILAILENYQEKDGCIRVPRALRPYLDFKIISRK